MRRIYLGYRAALLQAVQLGYKMGHAIKGATLKYIMPSRFRKKRGPLPHRSKVRLTGIAGGPSMICDRSSSFKKMRRSVNQGASTIQPDQRAVMRHMVRRVEIQRAKNRAAMEAGR